MRDNQALVIAAVDKIFNKHERGVTQNCFADDFVDHSPLVDDVSLTTPIERALSGAGQTSYEIIRAVPDGDLVALHGIYSGLTEQRLLGFDIYRVANDRIVERWANLTELAAPNDSGRSQFDGPTEPDSGADTEANRHVVLEFMSDVLIGQNYANIADYTNGNILLQHSPDISDGADALRDFMLQLQSEGAGPTYSRVHRTVAHRNFVLTHSEGSITGERFAFCELWRVEDGKIAELWDAVGPVPEDDQLAHGCGAFNSKIS